ncbi:MAG: carboxypeptidase regulatory-like domain-containing protein [Vicinamibacterales bacterium]
MTALLLVGLTTGQLPAEKPPQEKPAAAPAPPPKPAQPPAAPRAPIVRPSITVMVTDRTGRALPDVAVKATGAMEREGKTDAEGTVVLRNVGAGTYRLRFESPTTITFEREVTVAAGRPLKTSVELSPAPVAPPPPAPKPEPAAAPPTPPAAAPPPPGPPTSIDVISFYEKNSVSRGTPFKSSQIGCTGTSTGSLLQIRDAVAEHTHADADETLYVIAGDGAMKIGSTEMTLPHGTFAVIPRGAPHIISRRSGSIMLVVSVLTGPPCVAPGK